jgi:hypothetical protein
VDDRGPVRRDIRAHGTKAANGLVEGSRRESELWCLRAKTELWLLCASGMLPRGLRIRSEAIDATVATQVSGMFGTDIWTEALRATRAGYLSGSEFRGELTNLMRWRPEHDLGYTTTLVFHVTNASGNGIFDHRQRGPGPAAQSPLTGRRPCAFAQVKLSDR